VLLPYTGRLQCNSEGKPHIVGPAELFNLSKHDHTYYFHAVAAITDTDILFLKWYEPEERHRIVKRLLYTEISFISKFNPLTLYLSQLSVVTRHKQQ
jgi:hypothetical protein